MEFREKTNFKSGVKVTVQGPVWPLTPFIIHKYKTKLCLMTKREERICRFFHFLLNIEEIQAREFKRSTCCHNF